MFANVDDGSCENIAIYGCTDSNYDEFDENANVDGWLWSRINSLWLYRCCLC